ncbi:MAG: hypothetical protein KF844_06760 [Cryobacterium sp.]|nr:hypothetical protein [Cryobacterium sp.]
MSALRAIEFEQAPVASARHLEVVSSKPQRKARPRAFYAIVTVSSLFAILMVQLLLSIAVSNGAYQIASLHKQESELSRDQQSLTEELQVLRSPQHLAGSAESLGMVANPSTAYLRLSDGTVTGTPVAATASDKIVLGEDGQTLVPNQLLGNLTPVVATTPTSQSSLTNTPASSTNQQAQQSPQPNTPAGALPTPITR